MSNIKEFLEGNKDFGDVVEAPNRRTQSLNVEQVVALVEQWLRGNNYEFTKKEAPDIIDLNFEHPDYSGEQSVIVRKGTSPVEIVFRNESNLARNRQSEVLFIDNFNKFEQDFQKAFNLFFDK